MAKQPYYHSLGLLFTSTDGDHDKYQKAAIEAIKKVDGVVPESVEFEYHESEPGDPADL